MGIRDEVDTQGTVLGPPATPKGNRDEVDTQGTVRGPPATPFCSCRRGRYRVLEDARGIRDEVDAQGPVRGLPATPNRCCRALEAKGVSGR